MGKKNVTGDSADEIVVNGVINLILSGKFSAGSKLPTETQLMELLSVSRSSVREGIKVLKTLGLVKVIRGDGTYVSEPDNTTLFQTLLLNFNLLNPNLEEVTEFREFLELSVCRRVLLNATEGDIAMLYSQVDYYENCINSGMFSSDETGDMDIEFHLLLGKMTHNGLIYTLYKFIMEYFRNSVRKSHEVSRASIKRHRNILNAIESKNMKKLEDEIVGMGREWRENIEKYAGSQGIEPTSLLTPCFG